MYDQKTLAIVPMKMPLLSNAKCLTYLVGQLLNIQPIESMGATIKFNR